MEQRYKRRPRQFVSGRDAKAAAAGSAALLPQELLLKVARGEIVDGEVPNFAQRLAAAKQILPYYAPRLSPTPAPQEPKSAQVTIVRFGDIDESALAAPTAAQ